MAQLYHPGNVQCITPLWRENFLIWDLLHGCFPFGSAIKTFREWSCSLLGKSQSSPSPACVNHLVEVFRFTPEPTSTTHDPVNSSSNVNGTKRKRLKQVVGMVVFGKTTWQSKPRVQIATWICNQIAIFKLQNHTAKGTFALAPAGTWRSNGKLEAGQQRSNTAAAMEDCFLKNSGCTTK